MKYTDHCLTDMIHNMEIPLLMRSTGWPQEPTEKCTHKHKQSCTACTHTQHTHTLILQNHFKVYQFSVRRQITQSARHGWESTIKCCSEHKLSHDSLQWRDRSHDMTGREGCHIGQRLWNYLGWHSLAFPCKILPQGAMRRLIIDVNTDKCMLMSQCPKATLNLHTISLLPSGKELVR